MALWAKVIVLSKTVAMIGNFSDLVHTAASETTILKIQKKTGSRTDPTLVHMTFSTFSICQIINDIANGKSWHWLQDDEVWCDLMLVLYQWSLNCDIDYFLWYQECDDFSNLLINILLWLKIQHCDFRRLYWTLDDLYQWFVDICLLLTARQHSLLCRALS